MVALAVQQISMTPGVTQTFVAPAAAAADNTAPPGDRVFLEFENSNAATRTVTLLVPASAGLDVYGTTFADLVYTLAALTGRQRIGPLDPKFASPTDGLVHFTVSVDTGVTCAALRS